MSKRHRAGIFILGLVFIFLGMVLSPPLFGASRGETGDYEFRYHNYQESLSILKALQRDYPELMKLYSIGKGAVGNREIWCAELSNRGTGSAADKPAVYFDGNQHASEVMGGEVTLYLVHYLLTGYKDIPEVKKLLDTRVIYIVQRADPDGAEAFMTGRVDWDPARAPGAEDRDGDGKKGEDGPQDIDGDGEILKMRKPDPDGDWKTSDEDPRLLVRRGKEDHEGVFYRVWDEGLDSDADGEVNEDPPRTGFISNRNYPAFWATPDGRFRGRGDYPLQEHNARLLVDFILSRPHISQVESYHTTSGIHLRPYAARPDSDFPPQDLQDFSAVLAKGTELTTYPVASIYNDFTTIDPDLPPDRQPGVRHGVFIDWAYVHEGLFALTTELWTLESFLNEIGWGKIPRDRPLFAIPGRYNRPDVQAVVMKWLDRHQGDEDLGGQGFVDWKNTAHPTLGEVEIGGFTRYWLRNPPPGPYFRRVAVDQARFAVAQALTTPLVKILNVEVKRNDENGWRITAEAANTGYLDTSLEQARRVGIAEKDRLIIELPKGAATDNPVSVDFNFMRGTRGGESLSIYSASWEIQASPGTTARIRLHSEKGGSDEREVILK